MIVAEIEFRGIQTFVFQSPRLRDMVGANVLLGETIRRRLPKLALDCGAEDAGTGVNVPSAIDGDPLGSGDALDADDPAALYRCGILCRDGGHFGAIFDRQVASPEGEARALRFLRAADGMLLREVPGLRCDFRIRRVHDDGTSSLVLGGMPRTGGDEEMPVSSPSFALCAATGTERATTRDEDATREPLSAPIKARRLAYRRFRKDGRAGDIISLMDVWMRQTPASGIVAGDMPPDINRMCGSDYLAVIHADGNSVGATAQRNAEKVAVQDRSSFLAHEAAFEAFHHANRTALRMALATALAKAFPAPSGAEPADVGQAPPRPFQLLMLGGDDLLLVCQAKCAMPFVTALARALAEGGTGLTLGIGVAIAAPNMPFHSLVGLAEDLAASAKRLYRCLSGSSKEASVVDWHIETGSWTPDLAALRRSSGLVLHGAEQCVLLQRPMRVLADTTDQPALDTLEGLLRATSALEGSARSQLRWIASELGRGRQQAEMSFGELPGDLRAVLADPQHLGLDSPWREVAPGCWATPIRDLVELLEIARLGTRKAERQRSKS